VCVRTFVRRLSGHALRFRVQPFAANSKLGVGWNTTRLHAKDYISSDPKSEAKSVVVTVEGMQRPASCLRNTSGRKNRTRVSGRLRGDRKPSRSEAGREYERGSRPVKPRSAKSAERFTAALRSGALTGRAHARKSPPAMFGMSLSAPAGQPLQRGDPIPSKK
jgi:hypothetical protein